MEVSFMILWKGCTPWHGLLLTASLLTCWYPPTTAQVTIELLPPSVFQGDNVLLQVHNLPENLLAFAWFKGVTNLKRGIAMYSLKYNLSVTGPAHSDRETVYSNGSLLFERVTYKDTGFYTLLTISRQAEVVSTTMYLHVDTSILTCAQPPTSVQPTIESVPSRVAEGASVLLLVHNLPENLRALFWYKGVNVLKNLEVARLIGGKISRVLGPGPSGRETMYRNGSLLLHNVTMKDTGGFYTLGILSRDMKVKLARVQLHVDTSSSACCNPLTPAPLTIEAMPRNAAKGKSALLLVHNLPENLLAFTWFKGVYSTRCRSIVNYTRATNYTIRGPAHRGREVVYANGSLLLQGITEKDAGFYTLQTLNRDFKVEKAHVLLHVKKPVTEPFLRVTDRIVKVQSSVVFSCLSADTGISIRWIFNNRSLQLTERMTLSPTKCGLSIDPIRKEDAGHYKCEVSNIVSSMTSLPVRLVVVN